MMQQISERNMSWSNTLNMNTNSDVQPQFHLLRTHTKVWNKPAMISLLNQCIYMTTTEISLCK